MAPQPTSQVRTLSAWLEPEALRLDAGRAEARRALLESGFPTTSDDRWKHMGLDEILKPEWRPVPEDFRAEAPAQPGGLELSWSDAAALWPAEFEQQAFARLNSIFFKRALRVNVPKNICTLRPLKLAPAPAEAQAAAGWMIHPRARISLEAGSRLDVFLDCGRLPAQKGLVNLTLDLELKEQTALNLVIAGPPANVVSLLNMTSVQRRDSVLRVFCLETRAGLSRLDLSSALCGENASIDLFGLALLGQESRAYHHLHVDHRVPHTQSQQVFKSVLSGSSRFEYDSLVTIRPEAPQSSSEQLNRNLVLSDNARAYARPQLEIRTDDVQCHHGATVGQMNAEELLYLRTRGIDPASASQLVLRGFVDDILKEIPVASVAAELTRQAHARLEEIVR